MPCEWLLRVVVAAALALTLVRPEDGQVWRARRRVRTTVELGRAGITDLEVGYSARNAREWDELMDALSVFGLVETTADDLRRACQVQRMLARKHQRGRKIPDLLIAAAAETQALIVLHYDGDFDRISAVTGQPCEWVVPSGSID